MRKLIYISMLLSLMTACNNEGISERLGDIDSLVAEEKFDSACMLLKEIKGKEIISMEEQAHYYLLSTQLAFVANQPFASDSLLDKSIIYYNKVENHHKLADAFYYKSLYQRHHHNYPQAIMFCKKAEQLASNTGDSRLKFKIWENLAFLNGRSGNYRLQLQYAKKALQAATLAQNYNWIAYSYHQICSSFSNLNQPDSMLFYIKRMEPYIKAEYKTNRPGFLTSIGILYKEKDRQKAKEYFERALVFGDYSAALENLADVYSAEGNQEEAYKLWKRALTVNDSYIKEKSIYGILAYDLEHGNTEEACEKLDEIVHIKDSILNKLKNDTIKDLQFRFDHQVAMHKQERVISNWQKGTMGAAILILLLIIFVARNKYENQIKMQEVQMQINDYMDQIRALKAAGENDTEAIAELNHHIKKLLDDKATGLKQGRLLYQDILDGKTISTWKKKEKELFINFYAAIDYRTVNRLRQTKRKEELTVHSLFYLLLVEMGKDDEEIQRQMGISYTALRVLKTRTKPIE